MSSSVKTYFLSPNFGFPPSPDGLIALGSVIIDPKKPERSLNKNSQVTISPSSIYNAHMDNWESSRGQLRELRGGIRANFLQMIVGVGGAVEASRSHDMNEVYRCERLETQYFQPDNNYIYESLQNPRVKGFIEMGWSRKPVYMVTGLKVARGFTAETSKGEEHGFDGNVGADGASAGVPVSGGPSAKWTSRSNEGISFTASSDFVFAFQLIKIRSRKDGTLTEEAFNKGAMYEAGDDDEGEEGNDGGSEGLRDVWEISALDRPSNEFPGVVVSSTQDEYGNPCNIVSSAVA